MPSFYIRFNTNGEQYARREGNSAADWQQVFFDDIFTTSVKELRYFPEETAIDSDFYVWLVGKRWVYKARPDTRRDSDTLFVFEFKERQRRFRHRLPREPLVLQGDFRHIKSLATETPPRGDNLPAVFLPPSPVVTAKVLPIVNSPESTSMRPDSIVPPRLLEPTTINPTLFFELMDHLGRWPATSILPEYASAKLMDGAALLTRIQAFYNKSEIYDRCLPSWATSRQRLLLSGNGTVASPEEIAALPELFGAAFLENLSKADSIRSSSELLGHVSELLILPPADGVLQQLVYGWIIKAPKDERLPRVLQTAQWLEQPHQAQIRMGWFSTLSEAAKQGKFRRPLTGSSWEQLKQWIDEQVPTSKSLDSLPARPIPEASGTKTEPTVETPDLTLLTSSAPRTLSAEPAVPADALATSAQTASEDSIQNVLAALPSAVSLLGPANEAPPILAQPDAELAVTQTDGPYERLCELGLGEIFQFQNRVGLQLELQKLAPYCSALNDLMTSTSPETLLQLREQLDSMAVLVRSALSRLPSVEELVTARTQLGGLLSQLQALPASLAAKSWLPQVGSLEEVEAILRLLRNPLLGALPDWLIAELAQLQAPAGYETMIARIVTQALQRERLEGVLSSLVEQQPLSSEEQNRLRQTKRPSIAPADSAAALRTALDVLRGKQVSIENFIDLGAWVEREWQAQSGLDKQRLLLRDLNRLQADLQRFQGHVSELVWFELSDAIKAADNFAAAQILISRWSDWFKRIPGTVLRRLQELDMIMVLAQGEQTDKAPIQKPIEIDHCISDQTDDSGDWRVQQAQLHAIADPNDPKRYLCSIPVYVKWYEPRALTISLTLEMTYSIGRMRTDRDGPLDRQMVLVEVEISKDAWWPLRGGRYAASCILKDVPVAHATYPDRYQAVTDMAIKFGGYVQGTKIPVAYKVLHWSLPSTLPPEIPVLKFKTTTTFEEMRDHPLGLQEHFDNVLAFIKSGYASFMISAPRRYGKTTLIDALAKQLSGPAESVIAIGPVKVTNCRPAIGAEAAFREILQLLHSHERIKIENDACPAWSGELVPEAHVFAAMFRRAKANGINAIYLLFDEAQAMFLGTRGKLVCEYIKSLLEDERLGGNHPEYAALHIGLIGQAHMPRLLVGQLAEALRRPAPEAKVTDRQIQVLVRAHTAGKMQSTAEARDYLRKVSYNFFTLTEILSEVRTHIMSMKRTWFLRSDVEVAADNLVRRALDPNSQLVSTLRDYLNESDELKEWHPIMAYPVALAWSHVLEERQQLGGFANRPILDDVSELLNKWIQTVNSAWEIPRERIQQGLLDLERASILDGKHRFHSPILQRYLAGLAGNELKFRDELERRTLHALAVEMVRLPDIMEPIRSGGQAQVFEAEYDKRRCAIRLTELKNEAESKQFIDTCYTLQRLYSSKTKLAGQECLPVLRACGLTEDVPRRGVIIYDYIEGTDLSEEKGRFSDLAVVNLGRKIAAVVEILKLRDVVHCDIRPQNILRGDKNAQPYLVDFGLARRGEHYRNTTGPQSDEYAAPETQGPMGVWSAQSDVYALGQTLRKLRRHDDLNSPLGRVLAAALDPDPAQRATPEMLGTMLEELHRNMQIRERVEAAHAAFEERVRLVHPHSGQLIAHRHLDHMEATAMGMFHGAAAVAQAAQFLDELFGDWYARTYPRGALKTISSDRDGVHLAVFDPDRSDTIADHLRKYKDLIACETRATGLLRHANAHGERFLRNKADAISALNSRAHRVPTNLLDENTLLWSAVVLTAERMERSLYLPGITPLVQLWRDSALRD